ncbi:helix-turn-helix domain-containing protein [Zhouia amylolytica]|uniref:helix-turn-helix domain-containing protein n=1 Tax=Zhouia amylolytica TaxID=376730 RepID=UPI0020CD1535|nr:helix-turn-helix domain-containing protein [Zhouia amylolytica]MCQ0113061.1 helix-turn-helix domain-containing protein [Zhouia amylolytica]
MNLYSEHQLKHKSRFVNKIWALDNSQQKTEIQNLKILPNGCFNFAFLIGKGAKVYLKDTQFHYNQGIYLCSQLTEYINLTLSGNSKLILVQLNPWYFSYFQQSDFQNFVDTISEYSPHYKLFGEDINLNATSILEDIIALTEHYFSEFEKSNVKQNTIELICRKIIIHHGNCKISGILKDSPYSERWIQSRFKKATGLTLKQFSKIIQFRSSVDEIAFNEKNDSLTSVGYKSGYNDQSHFINNFYQFSKITPSKFNPENYVLSFRE